MSGQLSFDFNGPGDPAALASLRAEQRRLLDDLARAQGLPLGRVVRVEFAEGDPLQGRLLLDDDALLVPQRSDVHLRLRIGSARFEARDIVSCVLLDASA